MAAQYMLLSDIKDQPLILMRLNEGTADMERLDPDGWVASNNIEWTGIGGAADWDAVTPEQAGDAAVSLGRFRSDIPGLS